MTITKHTATVWLTKQYVSMDNRAQKTGLEKRASCVIPNVWCVGTSSDWMWVLFTICCDCYASGATQGLFWGSPLCCWISLEPMYAQCDKHVHFRQTCIQPRKCVFPIQFSTLYYRVNNLKNFTLQMEDTYTIIALPCLWWLALCKKFHGNLSIFMETATIVPPANMQFTGNSKKAV